MKGLELVIRGNNRSAIRALDEVAERSNRTSRQLQRDSRDASASFDRIGHSARRMRDTVGGVLGAVGIGGLAFGIKSVVSAGEQWQQQQAQLQGALRNTHIYTRQTSASLASMAESLATKGGYGAAENLQALTRFVTVTGSASKAQRDLTLSTNIARQSGFDFMRVQRAIMMLEAGRTTGLARLGIAIPKVTTAQDRLHEQYKKIPRAMLEAAKAQDAVASRQEALASLQARYGGAAARFSGTTAGRIENMRHAWENLQRQLGSALLPVVNRLVDVLASVVGWLNKHRIVLYGLLGGMALFAGAMAFNTAVTTARTTKEILFGDRAAGALAGVAGAATGAQASLDRLALAGGVAGAETGVVGAETAAAGAGAAGRDAAKSSRLARAFSALGKATVVLPAAYGLYQALSPHDKYDASPAYVRGHKGPIYRASGGPVGTDTIPGWFGRDEGIVNPTGMRILGTGGLAALNAGMGLGLPPIVLNSTHIIRLPNGRELTRVVTHEVLNRAARGPSNMVGGSLVSGSPGLPS